MRLGVQFRGTVPANSTRRWSTHSWPENWRVVWMVVPTAPVQNSGAQVEWQVQVTRQTVDKFLYFIEVRNRSAQTVSIEARYAVLNVT